MSVLATQHQSRTRCPMNFFPIQVCRHKSLAAVMSANTCSKNDFRSRNCAVEDEACAAPVGSLYASPNIAVIEHIQPEIRTNIAIYPYVRSLDYAEFLCQIG
jgi:hypothetical protein